MPNEMSWRCGFPRLDGLRGVRDDMPGCGTRIEDHPTPYLTRVQFVPVAGVAWDPDADHEVPDALLAVAEAGESEVVLCPDCAAELFGWKMVELPEEAQGELGRRPVDFERSRRRTEAQRERERGS